MLDFLFARPVINVNLVRHSFGLSFATANNLVGEFERAELLQETTGGRRRHVFRYQSYLALLCAGGPAVRALGPPDCGTG